MLSGIPKQWKLLTAIIMPNCGVNKYLFTLFRRNIFNDFTLNFDLKGRSFIRTEELIFKLRAAYYFYRARDDPPACPNASGHLDAVEVVFPKLTDRRATWLFICA